jgi:hypothetical protein
VQSLVSLLAVAGTLLGVLLGATLSGRAQRQMLLISYRRESLRALEAAYVDYLAAYSSFRLYVQTQPIKVRNVTRPEDPGRITPVVEGSEDYWKEIRTATARMDILGQGNDIPSASKAVSDAFWDVLESRAERGPGEVPDVLVQAADAAEARFAKVARSDLDKRGKEV